MSLVNTNGITYLIRSKLNGFVLDIQGGSTAACAQIISYPHNGECGTANQHWRFLPVGSEGTYLIQSELNNFVIDITGSNVAPVTPVISYPSNGATGTSNQQWELIPVPNEVNTFMIRTKLNGFVLDIEGGNQSAGARIISYPANGATGTANQHWEIVAVQQVPDVHTEYLIRSKLNGFVLDITGSNTAPVTQIISYPVNGANGTSNQHWHFVPVADKIYLIQTALNNFVVDITGSNVAPVTPVISYPSNGATGTSNQQWELIPVPNELNTYLIKTKLNGFVLDIEGGNRAACARIISYPMNGATGTANQHWELIAVVINKPAETPKPVVVDPVPAVEPTPVTPPDDKKTDEGSQIDPNATPTATGSVEITKLAYKGQVKRTQSDEFIEITNKGATAADLSDWKITSAWSNKQFFVFPKGTSLAAGHSLRVYTNEVHPETGGFKFGSATAIWNDKGDEAKLFDATGKQVATMAYGLNSIQGIKTELGILPLNIVADPAAINQQMALPGKVTFTEALKQALNSFLNDDVEHVNLIGFIRDTADAFGLPKEGDLGNKEASIKLLRTWLNSSDSKLVLLSAITWGEEANNTGTRVPEADETLENYWIFQLFLKEFSDCYFWAFVERSGKKAAYNYGAG
ncbi:MAG: RICIN domain-containing protein [Thiotrichaceae bacterium]|nr:RICIN domain-containing protein [Thiotrichaceae bacterium]